MSAYDDKRYINADRKTILSFGHFSLRDEYISKKICDEPDWGIESDDYINVFNLPEGGEASGWGTPDLGFNQRTYSNEELEDVVDLTTLSEMSDESDLETPNNPFILTEAEQSERADTSPSISDDYTPLSVIKKRKKIIKRSEASKKNIPSTSRPQIIEEEEVQSNRDSPVISTKRQRIVIYDSDSV